MEQSDIKSLLNEWVKIDNELLEMGKKQSKLKLEKKEISDELMKVMRTDNIDCFNIRDGKIMYKKQNGKKAITAKVLQSLLRSYFVNNVEEADAVNTFALENRQEKITESIVRKKVEPTM